VLVFICGGRQLGRGCEAVTFVFQSTIFCSKAAHRLYFWSLSLALSARLHLQFPHISRIPSSPYPELGDLSWTTARSRTSLPGGEEAARVEGELASSSFSSCLKEYGRPGDGARLLGVRLSVIATTEPAGCSWNSWSFVSVLTLVPFLELDPFQIVLSHFFSSVQSPSNFPFLLTSIPFLKYMLLALHTLYSVLSGNGGIASYLWPRCI
jgi:hypothetical protein